MVAHEVGDDNDQPRDLNPGGHGGRPYIPSAILPHLVATVRELAEVS